MPGLDRHSKVWLDDGETGLRPPSARVPGADGLQLRALDLIYHSKLEGSPEARPTRAPFAKKLLSLKESLTGPHGLTGAGGITGGGGLYGNGPCPKCHQ